MNLADYTSTGYFESYQRAHDYYRPQEGADTYDVVRQKVAEGLIVIGAPPNIERERLIVREGRYWIKNLIPNTVD